MLFLGRSVATLLLLSLCGCSGGGNGGDAGGVITADGSPSVDSSLRMDALTEDGQTARDARTADTLSMGDIGTRTDVATQQDVSSTVDLGVAVDSGADGGGCPGGCATGFLCGVGGVCRSSTGVPAFGSVYLVMMENTSLSSLQGNSNAPYINMLFNTAAVATSYTSVAHPSLPNYIALTSGGTQGIVCDCDAAGDARTCNATCIVIPSCNCNQNVTHLGDELDEFALSWRAYGQSMGEPCNLVTAGAYATRHLPFLYYDNVQMNATRCTQRVVDYTNFMADRGTYRFSMISPDLCHDMHDSCEPLNQPIEQGDQWLGANVPLITGSPGFSTNGVVFIVWDEGNLSLDDHIVLIVVSPLAKLAFTTTVAYNHYSLLATIEDGLGVPRIGSAVGATAIADVWR